MYWKQSLFFIPHPSCTKEKSKLFAHHLLLCSSIHLLTFPIFVVAAFSSEECSYTGFSELLSINEDTMFRSVQHYLINLSLIFVTECRLSLSKMPGIPSSTAKWRSELSLFIETKKAVAAQRWSTFVERSWETYMSIILYLVNVTSLRITYRAKESEHLIWGKKILHYLCRVLKLFVCFSPITVWDNYMKKKNQNTAIKKGFAFLVLKEMLWW